MVYVDRPWVPIPLAHGPRVTPAFEWGFGRQGLSRQHSKGMTHVGGFGLCRCLALRRADGLQNGPPRISNGREADSQLGSSSSKISGRAALTVEAGDLESVAGGWGITVYRCQVPQNGRVMTRRQAKHRWGVGGVCI